MRMAERAAASRDDSFERSARVLVCDDSPTALKFLEWLLAPLYEVCLAPTGERAVEAAMGFLPDVILCDLMLPGIPGTEVYRRIRAIPAFADVPFVIMTALEDEDGRTLGLESGADDYLQKPVKERELLARVASLVRLRRVTQSLRTQNAILCRAAESRGGEEMDSRRQIKELEAQRQRCAFAVCALESPIAELGASLGGMSRALGPTGAAGRVPEALQGGLSASHEQALRALERAAAAADQMRAMVDELEALLDGVEGETEHGDARVL
jgi:DNA-binding response OmpR family regulator